jgi:predicted metal-dependent hydrolase
VQPGLPFDLAPEPAVEFVRVRRARRYILRVRPDGTLRITVPRGGSRAEGERFAARHRQWIERERQRVRVEHAPALWDHGTTILFRGVPHNLIVAHHTTHRVVSYGDRTLTADPDGDLRPAIEKDLRALAKAELTKRVAELALEHGVTVDRVTIRNQRSRWGSCSPSGAIALNFRLLQMPPHVCECVLVHELMHRRQQNHSRRFWRLVEAACPGFREAERWLRRHGRTLF